jgi:hypothetical protein
MNSISYDATTRSGNNEAFVVRCLVPGTTMKTGTIAHLQELSLHFRKSTHYEFYLAVTLTTVIYCLVQQELRPYRNETRLMVGEA